MGVLTFPFENEIDAATTFAVGYVTLVLGLGTIIGVVYLLSLRHAEIIIDRDGLWNGRMDKEQSLIPWGSISIVRERPLLQCADLLDHDKNRLIRVSYQLANFETLRAFLNKKVNLSLDDMHSKRFSKSPMYHLFNILHIVGMSVLGMFLGINGKWITGYGVMGFAVVIASYDYLTKPYSIEIADSALKVRYPFRKRLVSFSDVKDIHISDRYHKSQRLPEVLVLVDGARFPIRLKRLRIDSNRLVVILRDAVKL